MFPNKFRNIAAETMLSSVLFVQAIFLTMILSLSTLEENRASQQCSRQSDGPMKS